MTTVTGGTGKELHFFASRKTPLYWTGYHDSSQCSTHSITSQKSRIPLRNALWHGYGQLEYTHGGHARKLKPVSPLLYPVCTAVAMQCDLAVAKYGL